VINYNITPASTVTITKTKIFESLSRIFLIVAFVILKICYDLVIIQSSRVCELSILNPHKHKHPHCIIRNGACVSELIHLELSNFQADSIC
jgi:hypothetical protein